jgi:hypothetical protein
MNELLKLSAEKDLCHEDLGNVSDQDKCGLLYKKFDFNWNIEIHKKHKETRSVWYTLWRTVTYIRLIKAIVLFAVGSAVAFGPILILNTLVQYLQGTQTLSDTVLWILVALMLGNLSFTSS